MYKKQAWIMALYKIFKPMKLKEYDIEFSTQHFLVIF